MEYLSTFDKQTITKSYKLLLDEELMGKFVDNTTLISCGVKTKCQVTLINRIINKTIQPGCWIRYFVINITGPDLLHIERCNRLIERHIPEFRLRQDYKSKSHVTIYTNEWTPDNAHYSMCTMKKGSQRSQFGTLDIHSPHQTSSLRPTSSTPWKVTRRERKGHYQSGEAYIQILGKAAQPPMKQEFDILATHSDIARFNFPNSFDRYATFKAVDNEHINEQLQEHCRKYLENLTVEKNAPSKTRSELSKHQSVEYDFATLEQQKKSIGNIDKMSKVFNTKKSFNAPLSIRKKDDYTYHMKHDIGNIEFNKTQNFSSSLSNKKSALSNDIASQGINEENQNNYCIITNHNDNLTKNMNNYIKKTRKINYYRRLSYLRRVYRLNRHRRKLKKKIVDNLFIDSPTIEEDSDSDINNNDNNNKDDYDENKSDITKTEQKYISDSDSDVTSLTLALSNTTNNITKASISTNFDDNTLDSLKSL